MLKIAKDLEQGIITETEAQNFLLGLFGFVCLLPTGDKLHKTIDGRFVLKSISFPIANKFNTHPEKVGDVVEQIIENLNGIR